MVTLVQSRLSFGFGMLLFVLCFTISCTFSSFLGQCWTRVWNWGGRLRRFWGGRYTRGLQHSPKEADTWRGVCFHGSCSGGNRNRILERCAVATEALTCMIWWNQNMVDLNQAWGGAPSDQYFDIVLSRSALFSSHTCHLFRVWSAKDFQGLWWMYQSCMLHTVYNFTL